MTTTPSSVKTRSIRGIAVPLVIGSIERSGRCGEAKVHEDRQDDIHHMGEKRRPRRPMRKQEAARSGVPYLRKGRDRKAGFRWT